MSEQSEREKLRLEAAQADYEARLALRQYEERGLIDHDVARKLERKWLGQPQTNGEWLSEGKREDQWSFSEGMIAGVVIIGLAILAFFAL